MKPTSFNPALVRAGISRNGLLFKAPVGGIPPRSGSTLGSATCDVIDQSLLDTDQDLTIHNFATYVLCAAGSRYGFAIQYRDKWFAIFDEMPTSIFPINLMQTGGTDGNATTQASYTYTITDLAGVELATDVNIGASPHRHKRPSVGKVTPADHGGAYYNSAGNLIVSYANEVLVVESC